MNECSLIKGTYSKAFVKTYIKNEKCKTVKMLFQKVFVLKALAVPGGLWQITAMSVNP